jgi:hypothetical protein
LRENAIRSDPDSNHGVGKCDWRRSDLHKPRTTHKTNRSIPADDEHIAMGYKKSRGILSRPIAAFALGKVKSTVA